MAALAVALGVGGVSANSLSNIHGSAQTQQSYTKTGSANFTGTQDQAALNYICTVTINNNLCAKAYVVGHAGDPSFRVANKDVYMIP